MLMVVVYVFCTDFQLRDLTHVIVKEYFTLINGPINEVCFFGIDTGSKITRWG